MFDVILDKIKECSGIEPTNRLKKLDGESVIVKIAPKSYDGSVCESSLEVVCVARDYDTVLERFDAICEGLDSLCDTDSEVLEVSLSNTAIKYDTVSGMTRIIGVFKCYTEVSDNGFN